MTKETQILPEYDYELRFDAEEVGAAACTYFGLVTDYGSPADILVRFPAVGFGRHEENAREKAEALAKEIVRRWNTEAAIKYKAAFHKDDRYLTTDDGQVFDRNNNRFVPDDELEAINTYEKVSTPAIADGVGVEWKGLEKILRGMRARNEQGSLELTNWIADNRTPPQAATDEGGVMDDVLKPIDPRFIVPAYCYSCREEVRTVGVLATHEKIDVTCSKCLAATDEG